MAQRVSTLVIIVVGGLLVLVSLGADALGVGADAGFGYKQGAGVVVGVALVAYGLWRRR